MAQTVEDILKQQIGELVFQLALARQQVAVLREQLATPTTNGHGTTAEAVIRPSDSAAQAPNSAV